MITNPCLKVLLDRIRDYELESGEKYRTLPPRKVSQRKFELGKIEALCKVSNTICELELTYRKQTKY